MLHAACCMRDRRSTRIYREHQPAASLAREGERAHSCSVSESQRLSAALLCPLYVLTPWGGKLNRGNDTIRCALDKGAEAHCVVAVDSYEWKGEYI